MRPLFSSGTGQRGAATRLDFAILEQCRREPEERCLWWRGTWWSRRAFSELVRCCRENLVTGRFGQGDRLALILPNCPLFWALAVAVWSLGGSLAPLNVAIGPEALARACRHVGVSGAVVAEGAPQVVAALGASGLPAVAAALDRDQPPFALRRGGGGEEDEAVVFFTSGTTSEPRAVCITHANLADNVSAILERERVLDEEDVVLIVLPDFHALGFTICGLLNN